MPFHGTVNAYETESSFNTGMKQSKITPRLAPAPRLTLWVPSLLASALGLVFLAVLAMVP